MESRCFLPRPTKKFSLQNREKNEGRKWSYLMDENAHMHLHVGNSSNYFLLLFIFFFSFFFACFPEHFFIFFLFSFPGCYLFFFLGCGCDSSCCCCCFLTRHNFFFFWLINWVIFFCHFFVLIGNHFLSMVYE